MLVKTRAIVISAIKFQEKSLIVRCFTKSDGLKSYFVRAAFSNRRSNQKIGYFLPLTLLEIESNHKNKGTLEFFKEVRVAIPFQTIYTDVAKSTIVLFISEVLYHSIQEEEKNEALFEYLEAALQWLDNHELNPNFHLILMLEITKYFGFYPETSDLEVAYFDMVEGTFSVLQATSSLSIDETNLLKKLIDLRIDNLEKSFQVRERQLLLRILIDYYRIHLDGFKKPKSLEVLKAVFE
jgi:DNA repair protein RecO (recombination protein O)